MKDTVDLLDNCNYKEYTFCGNTYKTSLFSGFAYLCVLLKKSYQRSFDHGINEKKLSNIFLRDTLRSLCNMGFMHQLKGHHLFLK